MNSIGRAGRRRGAGFLTLTLLAASVACQSAEPSALERLHRVLRADDQRGTPAALDALRAGLADELPDVQAAAIRALGRLESPEHVDAIAAAGLHSRWEGVRTATAHALAQSARASDPGAALPALEELLADGEPDVRGAAALSLGRLRYADPARLAATENALTTVLTDSDAAAVAGAARGLATLARNHREHRFSDGTRRALVAVLEGAGPGELELAATAAAQALVATNQLATAALDMAATHPLPAVRIAAMRALAAESDVLLEPHHAALGDSSHRVRLAATEALRGLAPGLACTRYQEARTDAWLAVRLAAIDGLARCRDARDVLAELALTDAAEWRPRAHALVSLARLAPEASRQAVERALDADPWQLRMYAARAAGEIGDHDLLFRAAEDPHPNVVEAALRGLQAHAGHDADEAYAAALLSDDYQLVMTAANGLVGGTPTHADALFVALERLTAQERETSRDPRVALLRAIESLADTDRAERLQPLLRDFDPVVAARTAEILGAWTGADVAATPQPLPPQPFPTLAELREYERTAARLRLAGGIEIRLRFLPFEAPTNTARFFRLARAGAFDGLTFHRVVYNFVIQGGSRGANEYVGDGPYTRDEITDRPHRRGTVGVSTRGRDTGDGQIFVNLADNLRLDFDYTIFAVVVEGDAALDRVHEGAVIESVTFEPLD